MYSTETQAQDGLVTPSKKDKKSFATFLSNMNKPQPCTSTSLPRYSRFREVSPLTNTATPVDKKTSSSEAIPPIPLSKPVRISKYDTDTSLP